MHGDFLQRSEDYYNEQSRGPEGCRRRCKWLYDSLSGQKRADGCGGTVFKAVVEREDDNGEKGRKKLSWQE